MKKKPVKIITIGGGSSYTPEIAEGFINNYHNMPIREWWLTDIDEGNGPKKLKIIFELVKRMFKKAGLEHVKIKITTNFIDAIKDGADFVTTQLRVGRLPAREKDELIPIKHGMIGQETNGIGGMFKALRTLPVIRDYLDIVKKYAPNAWLINFTNPSGIISEYVINDYKFKRYVGLCNVPISIRKSLANNYKIPWKDLKVDAAGVNHFVYFTDFKYKGKSYMPKIIQGIKTGELAKSIGVNNIDDIDWNIELIKGLNAIPCSYHKYYYKRDLMLKLEKEEFKVNGVRSQVVTKLEKSLFEKYKDPNLNVKPKELEERGGDGYSTVAVSVINAIYNDTNDEFVVSASNRDGMVNNSPREWVLEATCKIGKNGATKVDRKINIPKRAIGNLHLMKQFERATIDAFLSKDKGQAITAACINPLSHDDVLTGVVFEKLFEAHKKYLKYFNK